MIAIFITLLISKLTKLHPLLCKSTNQNKVLTWNIKAALFFLPNEQADAIDLAFFFCNSAASPMLQVERMFSTTWGRSEETRLIGKILWWMVTGDNNNNNDYVNIVRYLWTHLDWNVDWLHWVVIVGMKLFAPWIQSLMQLLNILNHYLT